jgi:hypothetical protein
MFQIITIVIIIIILLLIPKLFEQAGPTEQVN